MRRILLCVLVIFVFTASTLTQASKGAEFGRTVPSWGGQECECHTGTPCYRTTDWSDCSDLMLNLQAPDTTEDVSVFTTEYWFDYFSGFSLY